MEIVNVSWVSKFVEILIIKLITKRIFELLFIYVIITFGDCLNIFTNVTYM